MIIVGFGSKAQNGKDTAGEAIVQHYAENILACQRHGIRSKGSNVQIVKFAGALYKECRENYNMKEKDSVLLQNVGMIRRAEDPDYWVKRAFESILPSTDIAIFTDVRFKNEAARIKSLGGYLIEVVRLNHDGGRFYATDRPKEHQSEIELDDYNWDFNITSKYAALTGEQAITIMQFIRGLETK